LNPSSVPRACLQRIMQMAYFAGASALLRVLGGSVP
jgi:hypothetical protein